jgi:hypothetical protein
MKKRGILRTFVVSGIVLLLQFTASSSVAQTVAGRIVGTIRDSTGAVIPGASVSAKSLETGAERTALADESGGFNINSVPAGSYEVTASQPGFQKEVRSVTLTVGAAQRLDFNLNVGVLQQEQVLVTGEAPQVDTTTSTMSGLVAETTIRELPLNGRDWLQLGALQSGVLIGLSKNPDFGENVTHGGGMFMSISGGRPTANVFMVDGLVINDHANKSPGSALGVNLGVDAIREFSVLTSTYSAEYGRSSGGVINAITKGGTNNIHGTAFYFGRNSALDARNFFDGANVPPFRRHQFGGAIGGPIKTDKLFFFANYESVRQFLSESFAYNTLSPNARNGILTSGPIQIDPRIAPYLAFFPVGNGPIVGDTQRYLLGAGQLGIENYVVGRMDYLPTASTTIYGTYMFDTSHATTPDAYNNRLVGDKGRDQRFTLSVQHTFSPTLLNTINVGLSRVVATGNIDASPILSAETDKSLGFFPGFNSGSFSIAELALPTNTPGGFGSTGGDSVWYTAPQVNDNLTLVKGRHNIRTGFSVEAIRDNIDVGHNPLGDWTFTSIHDFLTDTNPTLFTSAVPGKGAYRGVREKIFGLYVQDDVRVRSNLTLNLGVRYEPTTVLSEANNLTTNLHHIWDAQQTTGQPMYQNPTLRNFAPRVGLAWDPKGDGKTSVRAGFAMFNVLPLPNLLSGNLNHTLPFYLNAVVPNPPASTFPNNVPLNFASGSGYYMQYDPPQAYKEQWNLNIEHQITTGLSITAGYVGSRGVHLPLRYGDLNLVPPNLVTKTADGHLLFPSGTPQRINPNFPLIPTTLWNAYSVYHSGQINITQRFTHGVQFQGVYVWSKNIDVGSSEVNPNDNFNNIDNPYPYMPSLNRGVADWDVPHHAAINAVWDLPKPSTQMAVPRFLLSGWELGGILTAQSGSPFSATITGDRAGTGTGVGNGQAQRPDYNPAPGCSTNATNPGHPDGYINLQCFTRPAPGTLGNLGRNTLRAPGLEDFDFSLFKNNNLLGEKLKMQFRVEAFNLFNRTNFGGHSVSLINGRGAFVPGNAVLQAPTVTTSRQIQFGTKLIW